MSKLLNLFLICLFCQVSFVSCKDNLFSHILGQIKDGYYAEWVPIASYTVTEGTQPAVPQNKIVTQGK